MLLTKAGGLKLNKSDVEIIEPSDLVLRAGESREFVYKIRNLTNHEISKIDLRLDGQFLKLKQCPQNLKPHEEKEILILASVPEDYDQEIGLRPHFFGETERVIK